MPISSNIHMKLIHIRTAKQIHHTVLIYFIHLFYFDDELISLDGALPV